MGKRQREDNLIELAECIGQLIDKVSAATPLDSLRPSEGMHRVVEPGLLRQLVQSLPPGQMLGSGIRVKPGSKSPAAAHISEVLHTISSEASRLRVTLRQETGRVGSGTGLRRTLKNDLLEIRSMAFAASDQTVTDATRTARGWVASARVALTWDAPIVTLGQKACPYCGGELKVRSDASSDVWCGGSPANRVVERQPPCRDENGQPRTWPRSEWVFLLERLAG